MSNRKNGIIALIVIAVIILLIYGYRRGWFVRWGIGGDSGRYNACAKCIEQQTLENNPDPQGWCSSTLSGIPPKCSGGGSSQMQTVYLVNQNSNNNNNTTPIDILPPVESGE